MITKINQPNNLKKLSGARLKIFKSAFASSRFDARFQKSRCDTHVDRGWYYYTFEGVSSSTYEGHTIEIHFKSYVDYCSKTDNLLSFDSTLYCKIDGVDYQIADDTLCHNTAMAINNLCIQHRHTGE